MIAKSTRVLLALGMMVCWAAPAVGDAHVGVDETPSPPSDQGYWFPEATYSGPMGHAPIGVMADHTHMKGHWMLSARYMYMAMDDLANGTSKLSSSQVTSPTGGYDYLVAPTRMTTQMLMLGAMYAPIDQLTLMLMLPYVWKDMQHVVGEQAMPTMQGREFTTRTNGVGDLSLTAMVPIIHTAAQRLQANLGFGFPTGSIDETDNTPMAAKAHLPYPMQLGSGSFELRPSVSYRHLAFSHVDFGIKGSARIRLNENANHYRLGEEYEVTAWAAVDLSRKMSASFRLAWQQRFNIHGRDKKIVERTPPMMGSIKMVPTAFPDNQGFRRIYGFWGLNLQAREDDGFLKGFRIAAEVGIPFWQSLDGPQLRDQFMATVGLQYTF